MVDPIKEERSTKEIKAMWKPVLSPARNKDMLKRESTFSKNIIVEAECEEDKYDRDDRSVKVNTFIGQQRQNFNDTNNLSQHIQTYNDEKQEGVHKSRDFEKFEMQDSENIINEFEEELKEGMMSNRGNEKLMISSPSPMMNKNTPSFFLDKKHSIDIQQLQSSNHSPKYSEFFSRNRDQVFKGKSKN